MPTPQINLLLTTSERDVLEAVAFLDEASASEVIRPVVSAFLLKQAQDPDVRLALQALQARRGKKAGKITDLNKKGRRGKKA